MVHSHLFYSVGHRSSVYGIALLVLTLVGHALLPAYVIPSGGAQPLGPVELEHFQFVRKIMLSDPDSAQSGPLLIAEIKSLDVADDGRMLVVDLIGHQAFLFAPDGKLLALLDPSLCHPGFEVRPVNAKFIEGRSIFLSNAGPSGYLFTPEGKCLGNVDPDYIHVVNPSFLDVDARGDLVAFYKSTRVIKHMNSSGKILHEITLPASNYPNATRKIDTGGLVADDDHLFYAGAVEPHILKMTRDGMIIAEIASRTSWFRDVSRDLPDPNLAPSVASLIRASGDLMASSTITLDLFELTDQTLIIQYRNGSRGNGYQIFTKRGRVVAQELGLDLALRFKYSKNGLVYRVVQPDLDDSGDLPNPHIEVYRFIGPGGG